MQKPSPRSLLSHRHCFFSDKTVRSVGQANRYLLELRSSFICAMQLTSPERADAYRMLGSATTPLGVPLTEWQIRCVTVLRTLWYVSRADYSQMRLSALTQSIVYFSRPACSSNILEFHLVCTPPLSSPLFINFKIIRVQKHCRPGSFVESAARMCLQTGGAT
jgi:hypothetical protein